MKLPPLTSKIYKGGYAVKRHKKRTDAELLLDIEELTARFRSEVSAVLRQARWGEVEGLTVQMLIGGYHITREIIENRTKQGRQV